MTYVASADDWRSAARTESVVRGGGRTGPGEEWYNAGNQPEETAMDVPACKHERTKLVARDENEEYFECLDCGEIFEKAEREPVAGFDDSLSDA
jgi:hypothetical protein